MIGSLRENGGSSTRVKHWFGSVDATPVELLSLFGRQGERAHLRARTR